MASKIKIVKEKEQLQTKEREQGTCSLQVFEEDGDPNLQELKNIVKKFEKQDTNLRNKEKKFTEEIKMLKTMLNERDEELAEMHKKNKKLSEDKHKLKKELMKNENAKKAMREKLIALLNQKEEAIKEASKVEDLDKSKLRNVKELARGGFGKVSVGEYKGERIALKVMKNHWTSIRELTILLKINNCPNLLRTNLVGMNWPNQERSTITVGLELCDCDLRTMLPLHRGEKAKIVDIMIGAAQALVQLSSMKIIHRDIKPENFLLKKGMVKLGDFGLASIGEKSKGKYGTPGYLAPEVIWSSIRNTEYDNKVDMWSLGAVAHEIITGEYLVPDTLTDNLCLNPVSKWHKARTELNDAVEASKTMLEKEPKDRVCASDFLSIIQKLRK